MDYFTFLCFFNYDNYFLSLGVILDPHAIWSWPKFYHNLLLKNFLLLLCSAFVQPVSAIFACANCLVCCIVLFVIFTAIYQIRNNHFLTDFNMMCYDHNSFNSSFGLSMLRINYAGSVPQSYVLCFMLF